MKKLLGILALVALLCLCGAAIADVAIDETNFPDANFRAYVLENCDADGDKALSAAEIAAVTSIECGQKSIASVKGIEHFTALRSLSCFGNQITSLDVSRNTALLELYCYSNPLTGLDVSRNTALTYLWCSSNGLTTLDVSRNTELVMLSCSENQLTELDVSRNTALATLYCHSNKLATLKMGRNTALGNLGCSVNQLTALDVSKCTALKWLSCYGNRLTELDVSHNTALTKLFCDKNRLTELDVTNCSFLCETVQQNERGVEDNLDFFGTDAKGNHYLTIDQTVRVIAGSFVSEPTVTPEPTSEPSDEPGAEPTAEPTDDPAPTTVLFGTLKYSLKGSSATVTAPRSKTATKLSIPATIKVRNKTYKVTAIKANAFKGMKKLKHIIIGKNVKSIGKNAFLNCKKLRYIIIKTTELTTRTVGANAFKGVHKKAIVNVPAKKYKAYKTLLKKKGLPRTATVSKFK